MYLLGASHARSDVQLPKLAETKNAALASCVKSLRAKICDAEDSWRAILAKWPSIAKSA